MKVLHLRGTRLTERGAEMEINGGEPVPAKPGQRTVFRQPPGTGAPFPFLRGPGGSDVLCSSCGFSLCIGMEPGMVQFVQFICPKCGTLNDVTVALIGGPDDPIRLVKSPAHFDGVTDTTDGLAADLEQAGKTGGQVVCPFGVAVITRTLSLKRKTTIRGS